MRCLSWPPAVLPGSAYRRTRTIAKTSLILYIYFDKIRNSGDGSAGRYGTWARTQWRPGVEAQVDPFVRAGTTAAGETKGYLRRERHRGPSTPVPLSSRHHQGRLVHEDGADR